jgi:predicted anti-sigma-YlaC factor YlaD
MKGFRETHVMDCEKVGDDGLQGDKMDVLYGEADAAARARVEAHLGGCAACREEMAELRGVRRDLAAWGLPRARPSFTPRGIVVPRWLATAALLLLGFGATLGTTGYVSLRRALVAQEERTADIERRHREMVQALQAALERRPAAAPDNPLLLAGLDARIDEKLRANESRQRETLDLRLARWESQLESQRRVDMARVAASLSYLDGRHGQQLARTNELMGYVLEASQKR